MKHTFTLLFLIGWLVFPAFAQESDYATVYGKIVDIDTRQPVDFVTVYIKDTNKAVESKSNGEYVIRIPANESIILVFTRIGYKQAEAKVSPISAGKSKKVDIVFPALSGS